MESIVETVTVNMESVSADMDFQVCFLKLDIFILMIHTRLLFGAQIKRKDQSLTKGRTVINNTDACIVENDINN